MWYFLSACMSKNSVPSQMNKIQLNMVMQNYPLFKKKIHRYCFIDTVYPVLYMKLLVPAWLIFLKVTALLYVGAFRTLSFDSKNVTVICLSICRYFFNNLGQYSVFQLREIFFQFNFCCHFFSISSFLSFQFPHYSDCNTWICPLWVSHNFYFDPLALHSGKNVSIIKLFNSVFGSIHSSVHCLCWIFYFGKYNVYIEKHFFYCQVAL